MGLSCREGGERSRIAERCSLRRVHLLPSARRQPWRLEKECARRQQGAHLGRHNQWRRRLVISTEISHPTPSVPEPIGVAHQLDAPWRLAHLAILGLRQVAVPDLAVGKACFGGKVLDAGGTGGGAGTRWPRDGHVMC